MEQMATGSWGRITRPQLLVRSTIACHKAQCHDSALSDRAVRDSNAWPIPIENFWWSSCKCHTVEGSASSLETSTT